MSYLYTDLLVKEVKSRCLKSLSEEMWDIGMLDETNDYRDWVSYVRGMITTIDIIDEIVDKYNKESVVDKYNKESQDDQKSDTEL